MKKYIALLLAAMLLTMPSCSSAETEETEAETSIEETEAETSAPETEEETKKPVVERPEDEEVISYTTLELEKDPTYDREAGILLLYFTDHEILYATDAKCYIGLIAPSSASSITGIPDMTTYPDIVIDEDDYCGIAIKVDEEIPLGEYVASVTFDRYIVNFDFTVE